MKKPISSLLLIALFLLSCSEPAPILTNLTNPAGPESSLPRLFTDDSGLVYLSWVEQNEGTSSLYYSTYDGSDWSTPELISSSSNWFVNWADFPSVIGQDGEAIAAHWLGKIPGNTYSYNVEISTKSDLDSWTEAIVPHSDNTATEHGFVSMVPFSDSSFYAIWLDGRNTSGGHGEHGDLSTAMTLRGAEISHSGQLISEHELDTSVCDCCNTSLVSTNNGLIAVYRNRTENEIRDIYIKRFINGEWEQEEAVYSDDWNIAACPVNGGMIDSKGALTAVAWFSGADDKSTVKLAFSEDNGNTFSSPIIVDASVNLGRVDVLINDDNSAWVSWITREEDSAYLNVHLISTEGEVLLDYQVSEIDPARRSGFPQITRLDKGVLLAWTEIHDESKLVKTATLE